MDPHYSQPGNLPKTMKTALLTVLVSLTLHFSCRGNETIEKIEHQLLNDQFQQAAVQLKSLDHSNYYVKSLSRIVEQKAYYTDFLNYIKHIDISGKPEYEKLDRFINAYVKTPDNKSAINLNFIRIKEIQITNLRNELSLAKATRMNDELRKYVNQFNPKNPDVQKATVLLHNHELVLGMIQGKIDHCKKLNLADQQTALRLEDTVLYICTKYYYSSILITENKLEEYIENCLESIALEKHLKHKSDFYGPTIEHLIDALIYKGNYDEQLIEGLLHSLYTEKKNKLYSFALYAKYIRSLPAESPAQKRVFHLFGVSNLPELCDTMVSQAQFAINSNELFYLYTECARALLTHKLYDQAFDYKNKCIQLNTQIYSRELAQNLADYQTKEIEKEKIAETKRKQLARQQRDWISYVLLIVVILLIIVFVFMYRFSLAKKRIETQSNELETNNIQLSELIHDKEFLFKELHHRVKNNFQLVIGFLRLQEKYAGNQSIEYFIRQSEMKLNAMAMVHEMLYREQTNELVDLIQYLQNLGESIIGTASVIDVDFLCEGETALLPIDKAIPIGLTVNEIIFNSLKHTNQEELTIRIILIKIDNRLLIEINDNGEGFKTDFDPATNNSLGVKAIQLLMEQIGGTTEWKNDNGARWFLKIPLY
jgi:two-component sensor histidine kinase